MAIRELRHEDALDVVWEELVYTEARLLNDKHAQDLAPGVAKLVARTEAVAAHQKAMWRAEIIGQAGVDTADDALDQEVGTLGRTLLTLHNGDRLHARYVRYFSEPPTHIIRLGLQSEVERIKGWPTSLAGESEKPLKDAGKRFGQAIAQGEAALEGRRLAASARADQRVREIVTLVDDVNAARLSLYGALAQRVEKLSLARDWPSGFFRRAVRTPRGAANPQPAPAGSVVPSA